MRKKISHKIYGRGSARAVFVLVLSVILKCNSKLSFLINPYFQTFKAPSCFNCTNRNSVSVSSFEAFSRIPGLFELKKLVFAYISDLSFHFGLVSGLSLGIPQFFFAIMIPLFNRTLNRFFAATLWFVNSLCLSVGPFCSLTFGGLILGLV